MIYRITRMPPDELRHYGTKGQHWGDRNYQNTDGTWTAAGQKRYSTDTDGEYGEPGGERSVSSKRADKKPDKKKRREKNRKRGKKVVEEQKDHKVSASKSTIDLGMKALNTYMSYQSFKESWM